MTTGNHLAEPVSIKKIAKRTVSESGMLAFMLIVFGSMMFILTVVEFVVLRHDLAEVRRDLAAVRATQAERTVTITEQSERIRHIEDTLDRRTPLLTDMNGNLAAVAAHIERIESKLGILPTTAPTTRPSH